MSGIASSLVRGYFTALQAADADALNRLIGTRCLLEILFLNPPRLIGRDEIGRAHQSILNRLESIDIDLELVLGDDQRASASGRLSVSHHGDRARDFELGGCAYPPVGNHRRDV